MGSPISKSPFLKSYRNQVKDALLIIHPDWDADEVKKNIDEIIMRDLKNPPAKLQNNYTHEERDTHLVSVFDWAIEEKPIIAANGTFFKQHKDAINPNMVQTLEHTPAIIHGGPFANIAHGCNSIIATKTAMKLADYTITEAGFGSDLGAEKFLDIKCRKANLKPDAVVCVATIRALKYHGGQAKEEVKQENLEALSNGLHNLNRHLDISW